jgi:hypothetical protein
MADASQTPDCSLFECNDCQLRFINLRYSSAELDNLYAGYRENGYLKERSVYEWWYTKKLNDKLSYDKVAITKRVEDLQAFLDEKLGAAWKPANILDYGGDQGQFIPPQLPGEKFVYDISNKSAIAGVKQIKSKAELSAKAYDFVIVAHVLEHLPEPQMVLKEVISYLSADGLVYVELPVERYKLGLMPRGNWFRRWIKFLQRHPRIFSLMDFYSTVCARLIGIIPPLGFVKMHEHINFFNISSITRLLNESGFTPVSVTQDGDVFRALARRAI